MERFKVLLFTLRSLTHNSSTSRAIVVDTIFEPVFWVVDHFVRILGPAFVLLVVGLTSSVVAIYYAYLLPVIMEYSTPWIVFHLTIAHWLLINIVFHYFKVVITNPGRAPEQETNLEDLKSGKYILCKKCIKIKPPRSHHCSICKRCVLKMDHHCPWINNCVGHFNHRYFISFCMFMCLGTIYVTVTSRNIFIKHFFHDWNYLWPPSSKSINGQNASVILSSKLRLHVRNSHYNDSTSESEHNSVIYVFMLCSAVTLALGVLTGWHCKLISSGETSIEFHVNKDDARKLKKQGLVFKNPYNFGIWNNWQILLGLAEGRSWLRIFFPSVHPPYGDGLTWLSPPQEKQKYGDKKLHVV